MQTVGAVLFTSMWVIYLGQVVSVVDLPLARRLGLQEPADTIDAVYARDAAGTARWDLLSMWTLPAAGVLMFVDNPWWPYLALIGGAVYVDTGGRQAVKLLGYQREGVRVGTPQAVRLAPVVYALFVILGLLALGLGLVEVDPT